MPGTVQRALLVLNYLILIATLQTLYSLFLSYRWQNYNREMMAPAFDLSVITRPHTLFLKTFLKILFIYSWETQREWQWEVETQAEGEVGSMQGARHGTQSWVSRTTTWTEASAKPLSHPGCPDLILFNRYTMLTLISYVIKLVGEVNWGTLLWYDFNSIFFISSFLFHWDLIDV